MDEQPKSDLSPEQLAPEQIADLNAMAEAWIYAEDRLITAWFVTNIETKRDESHELMFRLRPSETDKP